MSSKTMLQVAALLLGLLLCPALAEADYPETAPVRPFQLPDLAGLTAFGLEMQYTTWTVQLPGNDDAEFESLTLENGLDVTLAPHWQVFARMPLAYADVEVRPNDDSDCCGWGLGNLTLGGRFLSSERHPSGLRSVVVSELALSLATASDSGDRGAALDAAALARAPYDPGKFLRNTWTPRLTVHSQIYSQRLIAQVEGGLHLFIYDSDVPNDDRDLGLRLAIAGGVRITPELALLAELNSLFFFNVGDDDVDDDVFASVDLGVRYGGEVVLVGLRASVPIDEAARDLDMLGVGADVGVRF